MQKLNILVIGEGKICSEILKSKMLNKLYSTNESICNSHLFTFSSIEELTRKCKGLQIDIVILEDIDLMRMGVAEHLTANHINCFGINRVWTEILQDEICVRKITNRYKIQKPRILKYPMVYPLVIRSAKYYKKINSISELFEFKNNLPAESNETYLEEFVQGQKYTITHLYDKKNLLNLFPQDLNERQKSSLNLYIKRLNQFLKEENADFIGFINSNLIWSDSEKEWIHINFDLEYKNTDYMNLDIIFILSSAIYQTLNEINFQQK